MSLNVNHERLKRELELLVYPAISTSDENKYNKIRQILKKTYVKWLTENVSKFHVSHLDPSAPSWLPSVVLDGNKVLRIALTKDILDKTFMVINYLNNINKVPDRMSFKDAYEKVESVMSSKRTLLSSLKGDLRKINAEIKKLSQGSEVEVYSFEDGFYVVKLLSESAFDKEGRLMGNCVGSFDYYGKYKYKDCVLYSLRDSKGEPHVTFETTYDDPVRFVQVEGKAINGIHRRVTEKYQSYVSEFKSYVKKHGHPGYSIGDGLSKKRNSILEEINTVSGSMQLPKFLSYANSTASLSPDTYGLMSETIDVTQKTEIFKYNVVASAISFQNSGVKLIESEMSIQTLNLTSSKIKYLNGISFRDLIWHRLNLEDDLTVPLTMDSNIIDLKGSKVKTGKIIIENRTSSVLNIELLDLNFSNIKYLHFAGQNIQVVKGLIPRGVKITGNVNLKMSRSVKI